MEYSSLYNRLPIQKGCGDASPTWITAKKDGLDKQVGFALNNPPMEFQCPSNPNDVFRFGAQASEPPQECRFGQSAYRGMVATCAHSMVFGYGDVQGPPYKCSDDSPTNRKRHPDGAMFPMKYGGQPLTFHDIADGLSHTIFCVETIDNFCHMASVPGSGHLGGWVFPPGCTLYGMPADRNGGPDPSMFGGFWIGPVPYSNPSWPAPPRNPITRQLEPSLIRFWAPFPYEIENTKDGPSTVSRHLFGRSWRSTSSMRMLESMPFSTSVEWVVTTIWFVL